MSLAPNPYYDQHNGNTLYVYNIQDVAFYPNNESVYRRRSNLSRATRMLEELAISHRNNEYYILIASCVIKYKQNLSAACIIDGSTAATLCISTACFKNFQVRSSSIATPSTHFAEPFQF